MRNFNTRKRSIKSRIDHGKFHAKWPRAPPLSQPENLETLWETVPIRGEKRFRDRKERRRATEGEGGEA